MTTIKYRDPGDGVWKTLGGAGAAGSAGAGVPVGGSTGYLLQKKSGTDYNTQWFNPPHLRVRQTGALTLGTNTFTNFAWNVADYESEGAGTMWTPPNGQRLYNHAVPGYYQIRASAAVAYVAGNRTAWRLYKYDNTILAEKAMPVAVSNCSVDIEGTFPLDSGSNNNMYLAIYTQLAANLLVSSVYNWAELRWVAPL
jgi:hypothetical protein